MKVLSFFRAQFFWRLSFLETVKKKPEHRPSGFVNVVFFTILDSFHNISAFFTMSHCEKLQNIAKNEQHCEKYNIDKTRRTVLWLLSIKNAVLIPDSYVGAFHLRHILFGCKIGTAR